MTPEKDEQSSLIVKVHWNFDLNEYSENEATNSSRP